MFKNIIYAFISIFFLLACTKPNYQEYTRISYYNSFIDKANTGYISLDGLLPFWQILDRKKNKEEFVYYKAFYNKVGTFYEIEKVEKYNSNNINPIHIYFFKNGKNIKSKKFFNNKSTNCLNIYSKDINFNIKKIICDKTIKKIIKYKRLKKYVYSDNGSVEEEQATPFSIIEYNPNNQIKKTLFKKNNIKIYINNKLVSSKGTVINSVSTPNLS